jgi:4-hydroxy-3-polyprenylbenzoate decarboxylase
MSKMAEVTVRHEMNLTREEVIKLVAYAYEEADMFAPIASGSYVSAHIEAMVVVPCSMKTLSSIAHGYGDNLITRSADVMIKERKKLVIVPRETPLSPIHLQNMLRLAETGVIVHPPIPSFYQRPSNLEEMINQLVGRIIDQMGIVSNIPKRWGANT